MALERNIKDELPGILPMKPSTFHGGRDNPGDPPCGAEVSRPMKGDALKKGGNGEFPPIGRGALYMVDKLMYMTKAKASSSHRIHPSDLATMR